MQHLPTVQFFCVSVKLQRYLGEALQRLPYSSLVTHVPASCIDVAGAVRTVRAIRQPAAVSQEYRVLSQSMNRPISLDDTTHRQKVAKPQLIAGGLE